MTAQSAIHELKQVRQYCSARAIPAIDYAIQVLQGLAEREKRVEEAKQANPQSPQDPGRRSCWWSASAPATTTAAA